MKKILSVFTLVASLAVMCSAPAFAAGGLTLAGSADTANAGDEIVVSSTLDTSSGVKTLGLKIVFDLNDFELGVSPESKTVATEYAEYIGTVDYPTLDDVTKEVLGRASYVDDTYANTYKTYDTKSLGKATIGYEEKNGKGYVAFGYALDTAIGKLAATKNMAVGGVVLKAKTADKKAATITIEEATYSGSDGVDTSCTITNSLTVKLNGYGDEPDPTPTTVTGVAGKTLTGLDAGYKTFSAPAYVEMPSSINGEIAVTKTNSERKLTHALPNGVSGGKAKILPIVSYKINENGVVAGDVFTITVTSGETTVQTITYPVPSAE